MEGLRIAKPAVLVEGENVNLKAFVNQTARRRALKRNRPINNNDEEVWSVPIPNITNVNDEEIYANTKTPVRTLKHNYSWLFNKPETPKAQVMKRGGRRKSRKTRRTQRRNRKY